MSTTSGGSHFPNDKDDFSKETALNSSRNKFIDVAKGFVILWVIHIHTVYWSGITYIPDIVRETTLLIDVPFFFFISGFLAGNLSFYQSLSRYVKQIWFLLRHYLITCMLVLAIVLSIFNILHINYSSEDLHLALFSIIKLHPSGKMWSAVPVFKGSIWFIRVYLSLIFLFPLLVIISSKSAFSFCLLIFLFLSIAVLSFFPLQSINPSIVSISSLVFFLFVFFSGLILRKFKNNIKNKQH